MFGFHKKQSQQPEKLTDEMAGELQYVNDTWLGGADFKLFGKVTDIDNRAT